MTMLNEPSILAVCLPEASRKPEYPECVVMPDSTRRAIELLRMLRFDLLLVGLGDSAAQPWNFLRQVRACWPSQKWLLAGAGGLSDDDEVTARTLGATQILQDQIDWDSIRNLAATLRQRREASNRLVAEMGARDAPSRVRIESPVPPH